MNTLKPMLIFAVLIGVCYGVYSRINHKPSAPPPEAMVNWDNDRTECPNARGRRRPRRSPSRPARWATASWAAAIPTWRRRAPAAGGGGGNFPPSATFTLGPGRPAVLPMAARPPAIPRRAVGRLPVDGGAGSGQYDAMPERADPPVSPPPGQGYDNNAYGQPPAYGQDAGNGQAGPPGQDAGGYGQMPAGGEPIRAASIRRAAGGRFVRSRRRPWRRR